MDAASARYPGRAPIDAYGNGGFRFAGMSHRGSILCLPHAIIAWTARDVGEIDMGFATLLSGEGVTSGTLLVGAGRTVVFPSAEVLSALRDAGLWVEVMDTGAAARTYNVLLAEGRDICAALLAVD